jgi:hypothetical protein
MTKEEARWIVEAQKNGQAVRTTDLQTAVAMLARKRDRRCRLPQLTEAARAKANLALVWNLWQAMAKAQ